MSSLLSKIGAALNAVNPVLAIASGIILPFLPQDKQAVEQRAMTTALSDLGVLGGIITNVEAVGQALNIAGPDKLRAAAPQVAQAILGSALLANHKVANAALFTQGSTKMADGLADILNSLSDSGISTVDKG